MLFDVKNDNASGMEMMRWIVPILEELRRTDEPNYGELPALSPLRQGDPHAGSGGYGADPLSAVLPEMQICVRGHL